MVAVAVVEEGREIWSGGLEMVVVVVAGEGIALDVERPSLCGAFK